MCVNDAVFGDGMVDDEAVGPCEPNKVGEQVAVCRATGIWELLRNGCILKPIQELLVQSQVTYSQSLQIGFNMFSPVTTFSTDKKISAFVCYSFSFSPFLIINLAQRTI